MLHGHGSICDLASSTIGIPSSTSERERSERVGSFALCKALDESLDAQMGERVSRDPMIARFPVILARIWVGEEQRDGEKELYE